MKITTVTLGETQIEFYNSFSGKETIKVNGEVVSSKKSLSGTDHLFDAVEGEKTVQYKLITGVNLNGVAFDLYKDGHPVIQSLKGGKFRFWIVLSVALIVAAAFYLLINYLL
jgi:hypothetical protein